MIINIKSVLLVPSKQLARLINLHNHKNYPCIKCYKICSFEKDHLEWFSSQETDMKKGMEGSYKSSSLKTIVRQLATQQVREMCRQYHDGSQRKE